MTLLSLHQLGHAFGAFDVFTNVTAQMQAASKVGLVGMNGIGKTTLLQLIAGQGEATYGSLELRPGTTLAYLHQEAVRAFSDAGQTLYAEMLTVFAPLHALEARMRHLEASMAAGSAQAADLDEYGTLQATFEQRGGYDYEQRIAVTLHGLGFTEADYALPLRHLSGGQQTRALLARLLLSQPDLLILDEPTNHLDIEALAWLETTLQAWPGALLIVSHDRYFLDHVVNTIWEMRREALTIYRGNYSAYVRQRAERLENHQRLYEKEKERLLQELDYIKRHIARQSTNGMAVGRLRRLSRDLAAIETMGLVAYLSISQWSASGVGHVRPLTVMEAERAIKALQPPPARPPKLRLKLTSATRSGEIALHVQRLRVGYPNKPLFTTDTFEVPRGAVVALLGANGTGKSTLLKTLLGLMKPLAGSAALGLNIQIGYFAQAHETLNTERTVLEELIHQQPMLPAEARHYLAQYLFRGEDVYKPVSALSGGERARLALAVLARQGANFLLLDEPTNHLDIPAQEVLQEVLEHFDGTILLVTHDRYLVARLATEIWQVRAGHLHRFVGDYAAFMTAEAERLAQAKAARAARPAASVAEPDTGALRQLEAQIDTLERSLRELELLLERASAAGRSSALAPLSRAYQEQQQQLAALMQQWEHTARPPVEIPAAG